MNADEIDTVQNEIVHNEGCDCECDGNTMGVWQEKPDQPAIFTFAQICGGRSDPACQ